MKAQTRQFFKEQEIMGGIGIMAKLHLMKQGNLRFAKILCNFYVYFYNV